MVYAYSPHSKGLLNIFLKSAFYLRVLVKPTLLLMQIILRILHDLYINLNRQAV